MRRRWSWRDLFRRFTAPSSDDVILGVAQIDRRRGAAPSARRKRRRGFPDMREPMPSLGMTEPGED
jgi:hypothetical protein